LRIISNKLWKGKHNQEPNKRQELVLVWLIELNVCQ